MTKALGLACLMLFALSAEVATRCSVPLIRTFNNQTVDGRMTVTSGDPCAIRLRYSGGPTYSAEIVERPSNGTATVDGSNRIVYRSWAGFVGNDAFTYARRGLRECEFMRHLAISGVVSA